jgi:hypothetical protein
MRGRRCAFPVRACGAGLILHAVGQGAMYRFAGGYFIACTFVQDDKVLRELQEEKTKMELELKNLEASFKSAK